MRVFLLFMGIVGEGEFSCQLCEEVQRVAQCKVHSVGSLFGQLCTGEVALVHTLKSLSEGSLKARAGLRKANKASRTSPLGSLWPILEQKKFS